MKENKIRSWDRQVSGEQRGHEKEMGTPPARAPVNFL